MFEHEVCGAACVISFVSRGLNSVHFLDFSHIRVNAI